MFDDQEGFEEFAREIAKANSLPIELAREYASRIGDTPELYGSDGNLVVVRDDQGQEIARVIVPMDDE